LNFVFDTWVAVDTGIAFSAELHTSDPLCFAHPLAAILTSRSLQGFHLAAFDLAGLFGHFEFSTLLL
jgi:hypothetical protein